MAASLVPSSNGHAEQCWASRMPGGMDRCFYLRHAAGAFTLNVLFKLMARMSRRYALAVRQSPRLGSGGWLLRSW